MKKIGYAVLGLGIGMAHAAGVAESANAELLAACDLDEARLAKFADLYPEATLYRDAEALFADPRVDIISICLPSAMHADYAIRAMEAGKHVLIEKPIDITPDRARLIVEAAARTGMTAGVVHQNRFNLNMYPIKEAVESGKLGKLILGTFAVKWYRKQSYYDRGGWRGTWEMDGGGSLMNQAVHTVDLMQWLMGEAESVTSTMTIANHDIKTEDMTASLIRFKSGATATFVSTTCAYPGLSTDIQLYGSAGSIEANADRITLWKMADDAEGEREDEILEQYGDGNRAASVFTPDKLYGHRHVVEDMICAIRDGRAPEVTVDEAIKSVAIVNAVYRSAREGRTVMLDEFMAK